MNLRDKLTRQQVEERMELYREVFTTVRLLDVFDLRLAGEYERKENHTDSAYFHDASYMYPDCIILWNYDIGQRYARDGSCSELCRTCAWKDAADHQTGKCTETTG